MLTYEPTIAYGGILQMYVVGITDTYTMGVPLQILKLLAGDFDGDVLNILYIINEEFYQYANITFNPRNAMFISRNDGMMDNSVNHSRDTIVNLNTFINMNRSKYSPEQLENIRRVKSIAC